jgi:hypothetical protein
MHCVHIRLILLTCVSSDPTSSIWRPDVDRGAPGRGEVLIFILVNSWHHGSMMRSFRRACSSCSECRHSQRHTTTIWIRRVAHDDDLEHPAHEQEARLTTMIGTEFPQSLKNSTTTFQVAVRQPATTDLTDGPTRPLIGTSSTTTRSSGLALTEIRTMKLEE